MKESTCGNMVVGALFLLVFGTCTLASIGNENVWAALCSSVGGLIIWFLVYWFWEELFKDSEKSQH
jgi:hypothetical protein